MDQTLQTIHGPPRLKPVAAVEAGAKVGNDDPAPKFNWGTAVVVPNCVVGLAAVNPENSPEEVGGADDVAPKRPEDA